MLNPLGTDRSWMLCDCSSVFSPHWANGCLVIPVQSCPSLLHALDQTWLSSKPHSNAISDMLACMRHAWTKHKTWTLWKLMTEPDMKPEAASMVLYIPHIWAACSTHLGRSSESQTWLTLRTSWALSNPSSDMLEFMGMPTMAHLGRTGSWGCQCRTWSWSKGRIPMVLCKPNSAGSVMSASESQTWSTFAILTICGGTALYNVISFPLYFKHYRVYTRFTWPKEIYSLQEQ